nr:hypothetical protein [Clostridia bacterium]
MKKRLFTSLLAMLMLLPAGTACSNDAADDTPETTAASDAAETTAAETDILGHLPDENFDGRDFRVGVRPVMAYEIDVEAQDGEVTNDAIFDRNAKIEERFGVNIKALPTSDDHNKITEFLTNSVLAGDDTYDMFGSLVYRFYEPVSAKVLTNWLDVPTLDLDRPWWNQNINENATINGKLLGLTGSLAISYMQGTNAIFFNIPLAESYGYDKATLYGAVDDGKWTIDYIAEAVKPMYSDLDGNNEKSADDLYGFALPTYVSFDGWLTAFGQKLTSVEDGRLTVEFINEKTVTALEKMINLVHNNEGTYYMKPVADNVSAFTNNQTVFAAVYLSECFNAFRNMENPYGILPMPKFNEEQEEYHCLINDGYTIWGLPKTVTDYEFVGIMAEALSALTYKDVYPVYYDVALKNKYSEDADTARMVDIIVDSADFDVSFMYGVYLENMPYIFRNCLMNNNKDIMSYYANYEKAIETKLETVYSYYED